MVLPAAGDVVLVPFPFSDLSNAKIRPAVCLAAAGRGDWVCCQITSNAYGDPLAQPILPTDFVSGGLQVASFVRPGKLFTANHTLFRGIVGKLDKAALESVRAAVVNLITS